MDSDFQSLFNRQYYVSTMRPVFNKRALYSDNTENYIYPAEPAQYSKVTVRFRTERNNVDRVFLEWGGMSYLMELAEETELFDFYELEIELENKTISYCFKVQSGKMTLYFDQRGAVKEADPDYYFTLIPGFKTPDWAKGAVMYQILIDRFCNGDKSNDVLDREYFYIGDYSRRVPDDQWNKYPAQVGIREFYGGDLQGVLDKLDYLEKLGIEAIYFNPLFVSPSNHKYDIQDYEYIDPHIGKIVYDEGELLAEGQKENRYASRYINRVTDKRNLEASNEFFAKFVEEAHKRGIRVIIDGVFNHCGSFNKWLDKERIYEAAAGYEKGAYVSADSPYRSWFMFHDQNPNRWPYNGTYDGWWGHDTLPKLHYEESQELLEYILWIGEKWVSAPYHADGWRLDVAADLGMSPEMNHRFWQEFRKRVKRANPDALILAEQYGNPKPWLNGKEWDSVMNYDAFMEPVTWFLTGMEKHSDDFRPDMLGHADNFWSAMKYNGARLMGPARMVAMNELSNHDHSRFLTRTNRKVGRTNSLGPEMAEREINKAVFREAVLMQMTWPGAPTIYYGDEAGLCGFTDPDNRRTYPWGREDEELIRFHREIIQIHKIRPELRTGSLKPVIGEFNLIAFGRFNDCSRTLTVINNCDYEVTRKLEVWALGVPKESTMTRVMLTDENGFTTEPVEYKVEGGRLELTLGKTSAAVFCQEDEEQKNYVDKKGGSRIGSPKFFENESPGIVKQGKVFLEKILDRLSKEDTKYILQDKKYAFEG